MTEWYYLDAQQQQIGPVGEDQMPQLIANGTIQANTMVWNAGMSAWAAAAASVPNFAHYAGQAQQYAPQQQAAPQDQYAAQQQYQQQQYAQPQAVGYATGGDIGFTAKKVNGNWGWYLGTLLGFIGLLILGIAVSVAGSPIGLLFVLLGYAAAIINTICGLRIIFRGWKVLQMDGAKTTPGAAVGLLFVPVFSIYWIFVAIKGLADQFDVSLRHRGITPKSTPGFALATCILAIVMGPVGGIMLIFLLKQFGEDTIAMLHANGMQ